MTLFAEPQAVSLVLDLLGVALVLGLPLGLAWALVPRAGQDADEEP